jgi:hypothetical protein
VLSLGAGASWEERGTAGSSSPCAMADMTRMQSARLWSTTGSANWRVTG